MTIFAAKVAYRSDNSVQAMRLLHYLSYDNIDRDTFLPKLTNIWTSKCSKNEMNRALGHLCAHIG